jgi:hypothetical protein
VPVLPYHKTLVDRAVLRDVEGVHVPFVSLEDLIVLKMLWLRPKDIADIHGLIAAAGANLDADYVRSTLAAILPADDPRHAELANWLLKFGGSGGRGALEVRSATPHPRTANLCAATGCARRAPCVAPHPQHPVHFTARLHASVYVVMERR